MMDAKNQFEMIRDEFTNNHNDVVVGKMMSAPAISYKGKVFAFFWDNMMTFKLGKGFEIETLGITEYHLLSPFKTKAPMAAWFTVPESSRWHELAGIALDKMKG